LVATEVLDLRPTYAPSVRAAMLLPRTSFLYRIRRCKRCFFSNIFSDICLTP